MILYILVWSEWEPWEEFYGLHQRTRVCARARCCQGDNKQTKYCSYFTMSNLNLNWLEREEPDHYTETPTAQVVMPTSLIAKPTV